MNQFIMQKAEMLHSAPASLVGNKTKKLSLLQLSGYHIPTGFCLTANAYQSFIQGFGLDKLIESEIGRKSVYRLRWEEMWDAAFRIRHAFIKQTLTDDIKQQILTEIERLGMRYPLAVRSAATREDEANYSYAGLYTTILNCADEQILFESILKVWASLWSDAALLYQHTLRQMPQESQMAVIIEEMVFGEISGISFTSDPNNVEIKDIHIEASMGACDDLVNGLSSPQRWIFAREDNSLKKFMPNMENQNPYLSNKQCDIILSTSLGIEKILNVPVDIEWTLQGDNIIILQARPITTISNSEDDKTRQYFLSLTPNIYRLRKLSIEVEQKYIPELREFGLSLEKENFIDASDKKLANIIVKRYNALQHWRSVYRNIFVPFGHGIRNLGIFYNDYVKPDDAYEFVGILLDQTHIASQRNTELSAILDLLKHDSNLQIALEGLNHVPWQDWDELRQKKHAPKEQRMVNLLLEFRGKYLDTVYLEESLDMSPNLVMEIVLNYARKKANISLAEKNTQYYVEKLLKAIPKQYENYAKEFIQLGQLSWRLRDDDDILLGKIHSQTLKAIKYGVQRLRESGRLKHSPKIVESLTVDLAKALRDPEFDCSNLGNFELKKSLDYDKLETQIELKGQPAAHGKSSGPARCLRSKDDLGKVKAGEIIVCDGVDPGMTLVMPLCAGIVEMRGGMLIHGVIIARELGIPCVTGVLTALDRAENGDWVTIDGDHGTVIIHKQSA